MLDDLTRYWLSQGHCVHVIALSPKHVEQSSTSSLHTTHCVPQKIFGKFRQLNACHQAAFSFQPILARIGETLDIVHCLNYFDAYAALQVRRRFGFRYRVLFQSVGIPTRSYFRSIPLDWYFFRQVLKSADGIITLSTFAHDYLLRDFQSPSVILPPPVDINRFSILL
ncbi:MAG: glycosyltransferase family 4 protein, partial [Gammaproteobacteria bacterium]